MRRFGLIWMLVLPSPFPIPTFRIYVYMLMLKDLSPLFNWNTKQLFVYVFATYPSTENATAVRPSESILWDTIIPAPESPYSFSALRDRYFPAAAAASKPKRGLSKKNTGANGNSGANRDKSKGKDKDQAPGILRLRNQRPKYQIGDVSGKMAERPGVSLAVGWNVQPWVGALWWSPGSGTVPHTQGTVAGSAVTDFPPLKGSKQTQSQPQAREA